jgi:hypothetical protein
MDSKSYGKERYLVTSFLFYIAALELLGGGVVVPQKLVSVPNRIHRIKIERQFELERYVLVRVLHGEHGTLSDGTVEPVMYLKGNLGPA